MWFFSYLDDKSSAFLLPTALLLVVLVGMVDFITGTEFSVSILYLLPVSTVAWHSSRFNTLLICFFSVVIWFAADLFGGHVHSTPLVPYWNASVRLGFFLIVAFALEKWRQSVERELDLAREIQMGLLPKEIPQINGYGISCLSKPSRAVSGDYFDVIKFNDKEMGICIADVAGHSLPAAILMSNLQAAFKIFSATAIPPNELCGKINQVIDSNITSGKYITFFYALIDGKDRKLIYTNAGHHRPLLARKDGSLIELDAGGLALGLKQEASYESKEVSLLPGDRVLFFTDGIVEARNSYKEAFGLPALIQILQENRQFAADKIRDAVIAGATEFCKNNFQDDITVIVISVD